MNIEELDNLLAQSIKIQNSLFTLEQFKANFLYTGDLYNFYQYLNACLLDTRLINGLPNKVSITSYALTYFIRRQLELQPNADPIRFIY